mmetsp:Transcript_42193/g.54338  ORF Transcript_42193/g.54338 Transcript_42193/m.54338 type:complete len:86 (-) Transcript_42193:470-727(-)
MLRLQLDALIEMEAHLWFYYTYLLVVYPFFFCSSFVVADVGLFLNMIAGGVGGRVLGLEEIAVEAKEVEGGGKGGDGGGEWRVKW